jgi:hypothetical protein
LSYKPKVDCFAFRQAQQRVSAQLEGHIGGVLLGALLMQAREKIDWRQIVLVKKRNWATSSLLILSPDSFEKTYNVPLRLSVSLSRKLRW